MTVMIVVFGVAAFLTGVLGVVAIVWGLRDHEPKVAFSSLPFLIASAGFGWGVHVVTSVDHEVTDSHVARSRLTAPPRSSVSGVRSLESMTLRSTGSVCA